jgi:hypothetical protein
LAAGYHGSFLFLAQSEVAPVIAADKCLGADELLVGQLGKRIVEVASGRGTKIDGSRPTEIIRDRTTDDIEGGANVGTDGLNEVSGSIEWKAQGYINLVVIALGNG